MRYIDSLEDIGRGEDTAGSWVYPKIMGGKTDSSCGFIFLVIDNI